MTITRETLELAAKAAGYEVTFNATGEAWIAAPSEFESGQRKLVAWQLENNARREVAWRVFLFYCMVAVLLVVMAADIW